MAQKRSQWKSKFGFILAASGSAIGLGNIVFFPANAYRYGGGAFYVPYFVALFLIGIPVMITEFGLGGMTKKSFPLAMKQAGGKLGEFIGWFALLNAGFIVMYYVTILGWVCGMGLEAINSPVDEVFAGESRVPWLGGEGGTAANPGGTFANLISSWTPVYAVLVVWLLNFVLVSRGTKTIEFAVKIFVPLMWLAMLVLAVQGLILPGGFDGVMALFTPKLDVLARGSVWQGAISQMFFTLSLGFGVMTAYASYLPDDSDHSHNAITTSLLNCGFEWVSGVAIFATLFAFSIQPGDGVLSMMFFITPRALAELPAYAQGFAIGFFVLLLVAGLTSSISLVEGLCAAMLDKFRMRRWKVLLIFGLIGASGSAVFALPFVVQADSSTGTLGLTLVDLIDHWSFQNGLMIVGLLEVLVIGWGLGSQRVRRWINERSRFELGVWFDVLLRFVIPAILLAVLIVSIAETEFDRAVLQEQAAVDASPGIYGASNAANLSVKAERADLNHFLAILHWLALGVWLAGTTVVAFLLTAVPAAAPAPPTALDVGGPGRSGGASSESTGAERSSNPAGEAHGSDPTRGAALGDPDKASDDDPFGIFSKEDE